MSLRRKAVKKVWVSSLSSNDGDGLFARVFVAILLSSL